jgi:hypothetical protein
VSSSLTAQLIAISTCPGIRLVAAPPQTTAGAGSSSWQLSDLSIVRADPTILSRLVY